jgi:hypothetical protein
MILKKHRKNTVHEYLNKVQYVTFEYQKINDIDKNWLKRFKKKNNLFTNSFYFVHYRPFGQNIRLIGMNFSTAQRSQKVNTIMVQQSEEWKVSCLRLGTNNKWKYAIHLLTSMDLTISRFTSLFGILSHTLTLRHCWLCRLTLTYNKILLRYSFTYFYWNRGYVSTTNNHYVILA